MRKGERGKEKEGGGRRSEVWSRRPEDRRRKAGGRRSEVTPVEHPGRGPQWNALRSSWTWI